MSVGHELKDANQELIDELGKTVNVYTDYQRDSLPSFEARSLQHTERGSGDFRFLERYDIKKGSILQVKGARDLWKVIDTEDEVQDEVYVDFKVYVEKIDEQGNQIHVNNEGRLIINAPVQGGIQVGGSHNVQNVSININPKFDEAINTLRQLITNDKDLSEYQKEDAVEALQKLPELAKKEQSEETLKRAKDKLEIAKSVISISKDLAVVAGPYLLGIAKHFHILS